MRVNESALTKIFSVVCFSFISAALILIKGSPSQGYELSIYSTVSPLIWVLLTLAIFGGFIIVIRQLFKEDQAGNWWKVGLLLIALSSFIIVLLPTLRGYAFSARGDHLSHVGMVIDILQSGSFSDSIYPATHSLIAELCIILNVTPRDMVPFIGPLFYLIFVMSTYLLSREILPRRAAILATLSSTVLFSYCYIQIFPMGFAFIIFPLILFLYFRSLREGSLASTILLLSLIFLMPFFHPAATLVLILVLLVVELPRLLLNRPFIAKRLLGESSLTSPPRTSLYLALMSFALLMLWVWNHHGVWRSSVLTAWGWFHGELVKTSMWQRSSEAFAALQFQWWEQLELFIRMYGHIFVCSGLSLFAAIMLVRNKTSLYLRAKRNVLFLSFVLLIIAVISLADYDRPMTILSPGRLVWLFVALFPPLVGLALYQISGVFHQGGETMKKLHAKIQRGKATRAVLVILLLVVCSLIGILGIYESPLTHLANPQVTHMEFDGYAWLLENGNQEIEVISIMTTFFRFQHALYGTRLETKWQEQERFDDHFNYPLYQRYGESFEQDRYLPISKHSKLIYTELWPAARFTWEDFTRLENDSSVDKLYDNGEMDVYYVRGEAPISHTQEQEK